MADVEYEDGRAAREQRALDGIAELNGNVARLAELLEQYGPALHALGQRKGGGQGIDRLLGAVGGALDRGALDGLIENFGGLVGPRPRPPTKKRRRRRDDY